MHVRAGVALLYTCGDFGKLAKNTLQEQWPSCCQNSLPALRLDGVTFSVVCVMLFFFFFLMFLENQILIGRVSILFIFYTFFFFLKKSTFCKLLNIVSALCQELLVLLLLCLEIKPPGLRPVIC